MGTTRGRAKRPRRLVLKPPRVQAGGAESTADAERQQLKLAGFRVGGALYGIDIMRIKEVIAAHPYPVRRVPHAPSIVEGVIALRGVVIPVIDLRTRFGAPIDEEQARFNKLVIVSVRGRIVALKVDRIAGELRVAADGLRPAPSMLRPSGEYGGVAARDDDFFSGVCRIDGEMVFVVKLETLIDPSVGSWPVDGGGTR